MQPLAIAMSRIVNETRAPSSSRPPAIANGIRQTTPTAICAQTNVAPPGAGLERAFQPACPKAATSTSASASGVTAAR